ncbi:hypothetical protein PS634_00717 [Pseudomonas fluorescens]|nr:hypothetical protein PS634_00717 [Pseudomonas fluorescens]
MSGIQGVSSKTDKPHPASLCIMLCRTTGKISGVTLPRQNVTDWSVEVQISEK